MDTSEQRHYLVLFRQKILVSSPTTAHVVQQQRKHALKQKFGQAGDLNDLSVQLPRPYEMPSAG